MKKLIIFILIFKLNSVFSQNTCKTLIYKMTFETNVYDSTISKIDTIEIQIKNNLFSFKKKNHKDYSIIDYKNSVQYFISSNKEPVIVSELNRETSYDTTNYLYKLNEKCEFQSIKNEVINASQYNKTTMIYKCGTIEIINNTDSLETNNYVYLLNDGNLKIDKLNQNKIIDQLTIDYLNSIKINYKLIEEKFYCSDVNLFKLPRKKIIWDKSKGKYIKWKKTVPISTYATTGESKTFKEKKF